MDALAAARAWAEGRSRTWRARDAGAVGALLTEDARDRSHPFRRREDAFPCTTRMLGHLQPPLGWGR